MPKGDSSPREAGSAATAVDRKALVGPLNEDLAREYQAIIAYVVYSQVLKGAAREILKAEQEHQIDLATALGEEPTGYDRLSRHNQAARSQ